MTIHIAIHGAAGRMGQRLIALGREDRELAIAAALESPAHPKIGQDAGVIAGIGEINLPLAASPEDKIDALIDFSVPEATDGVIDLCTAKSIALVMATTGLSDAQKEKLRAAAQSIAVVWAPNMSLAVNLTMKLATIAAEALKNYASGVDVEIIERHHRFKEDAPSGTALKFGELIAGAMGQTTAAHGREGRPGSRPRSEIGYHAVRVGDNPGEHTIVFGMLGETIELRVGATNRDCYALGALAAAKFAAGQKPGMYNMYDVLGL
jgi:4-hydroxy-tetrahydrodipicolinate reductase